jgi:large subunit ribosomal protein L9
MKTVKLLLTETVDNLGIVGDVVSVKPGYARNYLMPCGLATEPTAGNVKRLAARRAEAEVRMRELRAAMESVAERLKGHEVTIVRSANEQGVLFGSVSHRDIADALRQDGFQIDDKAVRVGEPIKRLDSYQITLVLAHDLRTEIKLWVVSDKPLEQLDTGAGAPAAAAVEAVAAPEEEAAPDQKPADAAAKPRSGDKGKGKSSRKSSKQPDTAEES